MINKIESLWEKIDNCTECKSQNNKLKHILGNGCITNPKLCFIFINPTHRNMSSNPNYNGQRSPFLGTKEVWKVFINSNLLSKDFLEKTKNWDNEAVDYVLHELNSKGYYMTNVVKCTKQNADLPTTKEIKQQTKLFHEEISIINPKLIITFGLIPFKELTGINIKLKDHLENQRKNKEIITYDSIPIKNKVYKIFPCYFPVGRGNPKQATELLSRLTN